MEERTSLNGAWILGLHSLDGHKDDSKWILLAVVNAQTMQIEPDDGCLVSQCLFLCGYLPNSFFIKSISKAPLFLIILRFPFLAFHSSPSLYFPLKLPPTCDFTYLPVKLERRRTKLMVISLSFPSLSLLTVTGPDERTCIFCLSFKFRRTKMLQMWAARHTYTKMQEWEEDERHRQKSTGGKDLQLFPSWHKHKRRSHLFCTYSPDEIVLAASPLLHPSSEELS